MRKFKIIVHHRLVGSVILCALLFSGCANKPFGGADGVKITPGGLPAPTRADVSAADRPYLMGPFDKIRIDVFGVPDLSNEVQADASGRISFPLIGTVDAAGRTPAELGAIIEQRLRGSFVRNPQVTVNLKETISQVITIDGQVREPGLYPVIGHMSLMRAIATAKGTAEFAKLDDVVVFRTVDNQRMAALYNLSAIRRGAYDDPEIYANDVIVVGDSKARRIFKDALSVLPNLVGPLTAFLYRR